VRWRHWPCTRVLGELQASDDSKRLHSGEPIYSDEEYEGLRYAAILCDYRGNERAELYTAEAVHTLSIFYKLPVPAEAKVLPQCERRRPNEPEPPGR
jgi:hypothetical protein